MCVRNEGDWECVAEGVEGFVECEWEWVDVGWCCVVKNFGVVQRIVLSVDSVLGIG